MKLETLKKDWSLTTYLLDIKKIVDTSIVLRAPISANDHIKSNLNSLPDDYDNFITSVTSRTNPYTVEEIKTLILVKKNVLRIIKFLIIMFLRPTLCLHHEICQVKTLCDLTILFVNDAWISNLPTHQDFLVRLVFDLLFRVRRIMHPYLRGLILDYTVELVAKLVIRLFHDGTCMINNHHFNLVLIFFKSHL